MGRGHRWWWPRFVVCDGRACVVSRITQYVMAYRCTTEGTEEHDDTESRWVITDLDTVTTSVEHSAQDAAANVIYTLA